ncbi:MAG TPA: IS21 family transposase [Gemmataceae bacterium]|nr:IS21 family transposase [Gemmataceae bacterium]
MSNLLKVAMIETILSLRQRGWSQRRIARELGINRETVARYLLRQPPAPPKPAIAPLGSAQAEDAAKPAIAPPGSAGALPSIEQPTLTPGPSAAGRPSDCEPWRASIQAKLELGLSAQRIHQDLVAEHGFTGSYYSVRRFVRHLEETLELPFRRLECAAGEEAQVDFGTGAPLVLTDGSRRRTHVFRIVLSHSRKGYSEAVTRQTTDEFLGCLENAFWHFGGVPQRLILDNLRAAVRKADWYDPELNPKVRSFGQHYGVSLLPTRPYTPRHKGKVERGVDYVQENALKGRTFAGLAEQNQFLLDWERTVADTRVHGTTRRQVGSHFLSAERPALQRLPLERFPCFQEARRVVHRDGHVEVERAYYSVPPEYLARRVWARWDSRLVRIFNDRLEQIAVHVKHEPGRFSTQSQHIAGPKISGVERGAAWLLGQVHRLGPHSLRWAEAMIQVRGVEGVRVLQGLLNLAHRHSCAAIERACDIALSHSAYRLRTVRALIDRDASRQETLPFLEQHEFIRPLSDYGQFVHDAFQKEVQR